MRRQHSISKLKYLASIECVESKAVSQVERLDANGKSWSVGDRVFYIPNHIKNHDYPYDHPDCERGIITSMRADGGIWVRYESQHITAPGRKTDVDNLRLS